MENKEIGMENTKRIVEYSRALTFDQLPESVVAEAKTIVLDTLGALFAGWPSKHPATRILGDYVQTLGGPAECTVLGRDFKAPAASAALVNGLMGYAADINGGGTAMLHTAALCVPTALVMAERQAASGAKFITALTLGYDVATRVSDASHAPDSDPHFFSYPHSFHPSAVFGTFGTTAISGYMLDLDEREFINAYGLAGTIAGGLITWVNDPTEHSRPFVIGWAAQNGAMAALLASQGFGGPLGIFDDMKYNIFDAYSGTMNLSAVARDLGTDFAILRHWGFKKYPCCRDIHTGLDALLEILSKHDIGTDQIAEIIHKVKENRRPVIDDNVLKSHNAQYIMAVAAVERKLEWDDFLKDRRREPKIGEMHKRVRLIGANELADLPYVWPAIVEVRTADGRVFSEQVNQDRGGPENPLSQHELEEKFLGFAVPLVGEPRARAIVGVVSELDALADVRELIQLMSV